VLRVFRWFWSLFWQCRPFLQPCQQRRFDICDTIPSECSAILDLGCGDGYATRRLKGTVVALELDGQLAQAARNRGLTVVRGNAACLPFKAEAFEHVVGFHVLDHTPDNRVVCQEVSRVLKPGGKFLALLPGLVGCSLFNQTMAQQYATVHYHYSEPEMRQWMNGTPLKLETLARVPGFFANLAAAVDMMWVEYSWMFAKWLLGSDSRIARCMWRILTRLMNLVTGPLYFLSRPRPLWANRIDTDQRYGVDWVLMARRSEQEFKG